MMPNTNDLIYDIRELAVGDKLICLHSKKNYVTAGSHYSVCAINLDDRAYPFCILDDDGEEYWIYVYDASIGFILG